MDKKMIVETINDCKAEMQSLVDGAKAEQRALTEEETTKFDELEQKAKELKGTLERMEKVENMKNIEVHAPQVEETVEQKETREFAQFVRNAARGIVQVDSNMTKGDNGAVIPTTIANKIIDRVKEISPIFNDAQKYNAKGTLQIPYVDATNDGIAMAFATEFTDIAATSAKLSSVELTGYLAGVLCKVSRSLINNADVDIVSFVVDKMTKAVAAFFEKCALSGNGSVTGASTATNVITAKATGAVTTDELIALQDSLASAYQVGAYWVVNPKTLTAIRQLKDSEGRYMLNPDLTGAFGYSLLGKPVYTSDAMPELKTGVTGIIYVNPGEALAVKMVEDFELQVLNEHYAAQHAVGLVGWTELDCKIQNEQAIAVLKMA